jgi:hypothetical protein
MLKLTNASVLALKPRKERYEISDQMPGLRLVVHPSGKRTWIYRYRKVDDGRSSKLTLGFLAPVESDGEPILGGPLSLLEARTLCTQAARQRAAGGDPAGERKAARTAQGAPQSGFAEVALAFAQHCREHLRCWKATASVLGFDRHLERKPDGLAAKWKDRPLVSLTASDCFDAVEAARPGIPGQWQWRDGPSEARCRATHAVLGSFFTYAVRRRLLERSPMTGLARPKPPAARERCLDEIELRAVWHACDDLLPWHAGVIRTLICCGSRLREISESDSKLMTPEPTAG